jgi:hypothetical protein
MRGIVLALVLVTLGCRRTHPPGPGAEPETAPPAAPATENPAPAAAPPPASYAAGPSAPAPSAAAPATERRALPDGGTLNGDPRGPREAEVKLVLDAALVEVRACFDADTALKLGEIPVSVHFFVEPPGYTGAVTVKANAPDEVIGCTRAVFEKLKFREFHGAKIDLTRAFSYWKKDLTKVDGGAKP